MEPTEKWLAIGLALFCFTIAVIFFFITKAPAASILCVGQNACCEDAINLCGADLSSDRDVIGACLYQHRAELNPQCKENMKAWNPNKAGKKPEQSKAKGKPSAANRP